MTTSSNIREAIDRSTTHNEIVRCNVTFLENGLRAVSEIAAIDDYRELDDPQTDYRHIDVWGKTKNGNRFRLYLFAE